MADLPPRLSRQQQYILAVLAGVDDEYHEHALAVTELSWRVAREFDEDGTRINDRKAGLDSEIEAAAQSGDPETVSAVRRLAGVFATLDEERLTAEHRASYSRALARLEARSLVDRGRDRFIYATKDGEREHARTRAVSLTDEGVHVGQELRRRHADGRYGLSFATLDE